mmetsp:Transcript_46552/g.124435  ORF Transcript_46552/g.124435 Transcript_46552/m.124435 type:complete len:230 (-) Transcript_46552:11-700(-)
MSTPEAACSRAKRAGPLCCSLGEADVRPLHALVVDGEEGHAQELLLVDLLGSLHGLLVVHLAALLAALDLVRRVAVLEPLHLLRREELPDLEPIRLNGLAHLRERGLACVGLGGQAAALGGAHGGEPALEFGLEGGVVHGVRGMCEELHGRGAVVVLRALDQVVEALAAGGVRLLARLRAQHRGVDAGRGQAGHDGEKGDGDRLHCCSDPEAPGARLGVSGRRRRGTLE